MFRKFKIDMRDILVLISSEIGKSNIFLPL